MHVHIFMSVMQMSCAKLRIKVMLTSQNVVDAIEIQGLLQIYTNETVEVKHRKFNLINRQDSKTLIIQIYKH